MHPLTRERDGIKLLDKGMKWPWRRLCVMNACSSKNNVNEYTFQRQTNTGTETLNLRGIGNPIANGTGLIRSAFRPSDDATILPYFIPANAMMSVELGRTATVLKAMTSQLSDKMDIENVNAYIEIVEKFSERIRAGVLKHGVVNHPTFGKVLAYETDGYNSHIMMDDANVPSLLSLPLLGFLDVSGELYQNTRKMVLSPEGAAPEAVADRHLRSWDNMADRIPD